jgi:hypothetical protein
MGLLNYHQTVIAYHGCDKEIADKVLFGNGELEYSSNKHDWLGKGIYFWEYGEARAYEWAKWRSSIGGPGVKIKTPAVVGALINLGNCFDLLDTKNTEMLGEMFEVYKAHCEKNGLPMLQNMRSHKLDIDHTKRLLDCAVINFVLEAIEVTEGVKYHSVRCVFTEGKEAFGGSFIMKKSHIQIAIRDRSAILGYFKPALTSAQ